MKHTTFHNSMTTAENNIQISFKNVVLKCLDNMNDATYISIIVDFMKYVRIKHFSNSHIDYFLESLVYLSEEQSERFYQDDMKKMKGDINVFRMFL